MGPASSFSVGFYSRTNLHDDYLNLMKSPDDIVNTIISKLYLIPLADFKSDCVNHEDRKTHTKEYLITKNSNSTTTKYITVA